MPSRKKSGKFGKSYFNGKNSGYKKGYDSLDKELRWKYLIKELKKFKSKGRILDIGCAYGFFLKYLKGFERYGVDLSDHAIKRARNLPRINFYVCDIEKKTHFKSNFFDVITAFDVLEHLNEPSKVLREIKRLLKKDGIALFTFPDTDHFLGKYDFRNDSTHKNDKSSLVKQIRAYFEIEEIKHVLNIGNSCSLVLSNLPNFLRSICFIIAKTKYRPGNTYE